MRRLRTTLALAALVLPGLAAQTFYGDLALGLGWRQLNGDYVPPAPEGDLTGYLSADLYAEFREDDAYSFLAAVRMEGPMGSGLDATGNPAPSPLALSVVQCYLNLPFDPWALSVGKRYREIGWTELFNVANLVTPRAFDAYDYRRNPPAQLDLGVALGTVWLSGLAWFTDAASWEDVSWLLSAQVVDGALAAEAGVYATATGDWHAYASGRANLGALSLVAEGILDGQAVQDRVASFSETSVDYASPPDGLAYSVVLGLALETGGQDIQLEYLHRSQGYTDAEADTFIDAARTLTDPAVLASHLSHYSRFAFRKDYLGFSWAWHSFLHPDLTLGMDAALSLPDIWAAAADWGGLSCLLSAGLDWQVIQAFVLSLDAGWTLGGSFGEFSSFTAERALVTLSGRLSF